MDSLHVMYHICEQYDSTDDRLFDSAGEDDEKIKKSRIDRVWRIVFVLGNTAFEYRQHSMVTGAGRVITTDDADGTVVEKLTESNKGDTITASGENNDDDDNNHGDSSACLLTLHILDEVKGRASVGLTEAACEKIVGRRVDPGTVADAAEEQLSALKWQKKSCNPPPTVVGHYAEPKAEGKGADAETVTTEEDENSKEEQSPDSCLDSAVAAVSAQEKENSNSISSPTELKRWSLYKEKLERYADLNDFFQSLRHGGTVIPENRITETFFMSFVW